MSNFVALKESHRNLMCDSRPAGPVDPKEIASLTIRIRSRGDPTELARHAYALAELPLAERNYATHEDISARYGAHADDLDQLESYAQKHNLLVVHRSTLARTIVLTGALGDLLRAFPANVRQYHHVSGDYRGRQGEILVPAELEPIITGIFGFDTRQRRKTPPHLRSLAFASSSAVLPADGLAATFFAKAYDFPEQQAGQVLDGSGQTIGIIELGGGYRTTDLQAYFAGAGLPMPTIVTASGTPGGNPTSADDLGDLESMLDIEVAGAVAPGARIVVYFASTSTDQSLFDTISAAVNDTERRPSVLSISWGKPEDMLTGNLLASLQELFAQAATMGITVCASSGDHGTADLPAEEWDNHVHVDYPASDQFVLGCGGTQIASASGPDVVWNDQSPFSILQPDGGGWASGGGISQVVSVPSYQAGLKMPPSLATGGTGRGVPDIAMCATNYAVRVDGVDTVSGGTSAVAPLMAALVARLGQAKQKRLGFLNPFFYANAGNGAFRSVVSGDNGIDQTLDGYVAGAPWNPCTGLGTPVGTEILRLL